MLLLGSVGRVRDYLALMHEIPADSFDVAITPMVGGGLDGEAREARAVVADAERARNAAAARSRSVARKLKNAGLSGRDIAAVLGVSPQRVSQFLAS